MKTILRYQKTYNEHQSNFTLLISILFGFLFALNNFNIPQNILNKIFGAFLLILLLMVMRTDYYGDIFESSLIDYRRTNNEPHLESWKKIKEEAKGGRKVWKILWYSYTGFGFWKAAPNLVSRGILFILTLFLIF